MKTQIFIQARISSKRFPSKILSTINGKTILEYIVERALRVSLIDKIILVTGEKNQNKKLIDEAKKLGLDYFCDSEVNILERFFQASKHYESDNIIRLTGDNPLVDFSIIDNGLKIFVNKKSDILSTDSTFPSGLNFEIFTSKSLEKARNSLIKELNSKYFSTFMNPVNYLLNNNFLKYFFNLKTKYPKMRLTFDYQLDFQLLSNIFTFMNYEDTFDTSNIVEFLKNNPQISSINSKYN